VNDDEHLERDRFDQELGRTALVSALVHRTRKVAVIATAFTAYRTGFSFVLYTVQRNQPRKLHGRATLRVDHETLTVIDSGGNILRTEPDYVAKGEPGWFTARYFVLELPRPGPITMSIAWPGRRAIRVSATFEAQPILEAATKAEPLW